MASGTATAAKPGHSSGVDSPLAGKGAEIEGTLIAIRIASAGDQKVTSVVRDDHSVRQRHAVGSLARETSENPG